MGTPQTVEEQKAAQATTRAAPQSAAQQMAVLNERSKALDRAYSQTQSTMRELAQRYDGLTSRINELNKGIRNLESEIGRLQKENAADLEEFSLRGMREFVHGWANVDARQEAIGRCIDQIIAMNKEITKLEAEKKSVNTSIGDCITRLKEINEDQLKIQERGRQIAGSAPPSAKQR